MPTSPKFAQVKRTTLYSPITSSETTEIVLKSLKDLYGNALAMSNFGTTAYVTINPGGSDEEIISFTGFTVNTDGTVSINAGIVRGLKGVYPYSTGGTATDHAAGSVVVVSNNPQLYAAILAYIDGIAIAGAPDATDIAKGIVEVATQAEIDADTETGSTSATLSISPDKLVLSKYGTRLPSADQKAALAGNNGTPSVSNKFVTETGVAAAIAGITSPITRVYTTPGANTWTKPAGLKYIEVEIVGGGGGSAYVNDDGSGGGGAGGYTRKRIATAALGATETATVGAGGAGGTNGGGGSGVAGNTTSFGAHIVATGGNPSIYPNGQAGGGGSASTPGDFSTGGGGGDEKYTNVEHRGGSGGSSYFGGQGAYGSGGKGVGSATTSDGSAGNQGVIILTEYY